MVLLRARRLAVPARLAVLLSVLAGSTLAQTPTGRITGTVRDANREGREGARVAAINSATGNSKSATTGANGSYSITGLAAGEYTVTASLIGFQRATSTGVRVADGAEVTVDLVIQALQLQAVVVTATLREQELQDVPFSVASPTAAMLRERGADNIEMVSANVAGFTVQNLGPGQSVVAIRGTSSGQIARDQPGVKGEAGVYLDDSPISLSLFSPDMDLFDMSRVEVLRGPQGTLFGSGSLAGTVRYITNQPRLGEHSTFGEVGGNVVDGGSGGGDLKVGTNVPLGDKAAARLSAYYTHIPGYMDAV